MRANKLSITTRRLCLIAILAAVLCVLAPWSVAIGPIPLTLALFAVYLAGAVAGVWDGVCAVLLYLFMGAVGLPVFSGFAGGVQKLVGMTGGYLWGYVPCVLIVSLTIHYFGSKRWAYPVGMVLGTMVCYCVGTAWFMVVTKSTLAAAFAACILPFLPGDAIKIAAASVISPRVRQALEKRM